MKQKPVHPSMQPFLDGKVVLLNKPLKWTSFDAVKKVRVLTGVSKIGHAGTLDPLATGLLIICTGKFTKKINEYMGMEKEYTGSFTLGATTPTYDLESEPENFRGYSHIKKEQLVVATKIFTGNILQMPPAHSAIKKGGRRLYELARKGENVKIDARPVTINEFEITTVELPKVYFRVVCSTGTYIRSLVSDYGEALSTGAYLSSLCRTRIGTFELKDAFNPEEFKEEINRLKHPLEGQADT